MKGKKITAILMAVLMVVTMLPVQALAKDDIALDDEEIAEAETISLTEDAVSEEPLDENTIAADYNSFALMSGGNDALTPDGDSDYTLILYYNVGTKQKSVVVGDDGYILPDISVERDGYINTGWRTSQDYVENGVNYAKGQKITKNDFSGSGNILTLFALWKTIDEDKYAVKFDPNGGNYCYMGSAEVAKNSEYETPACGFTHPDLVFDGWATAADGEAAYAPGDKLTITQNTTFYPVWRKVRVCFDRNGGSGSMDPVSYEKKSECTIPDCNFKKEGYFFAGWGTEKNGEAVFFPGEQIALDEDMTLYFFPGEQIALAEDITLYALWSGDDVSFLDLIGRFDGGYLDFGGIRWRVIGQKADETEALLISADVLGGTMNWATAKQYCNDLFNSTAAFSSKEKSVIKRVFRNDRDYLKYWRKDLKGGNLFLLSGYEANKYFINNEDRKPGNWWLRSPRNIFGNNAGVVNGSGALYNSDVDFDDDYGARPAFVLNLSSVLFTSSAEGGKSSAAVGSGFGNFSDGGTEAKKLTLLDNSRSGFAANIGGSGSAAVASGGTVAINYSGAGTGTGEYVSAMLCNSAGDIIGYASVASDSDGADTWSLTLPSDLTEGATYTLKVFSEQQNGDNTTDYASPMIPITLTVGDAPAPEKVATPTFSPAGGTYTEAQSVRLTCATEGATIYYTTDDTVPTRSSSVYDDNTPFNVSSATTIRAFAVKSGWINSGVAAVSYTILNMETYTVTIAPGDGTGTAFTMQNTKIISRSDMMGENYDQSKGCFYLDAGKVYYKFPLQCPFMAPAGKEFDCWECSYNGTTGLSDLPIEETGDFTITALYKDKEPESSVTLSISSPININYGDSTTEFNIKVKSAVFNSKIPDFRVTLYDSSFTCAANIGSIPFTVTTDGNDATRGYNSSGYYSNFILNPDIEFPYDFHGFINITNEAWAAAEPGIYSAILGFDWDCEKFINETPVTLTVVVPGKNCTVTVNSGTGMTKTSDSGSATQSGLNGAMTDVVYTADEGYYFPEDYSVLSENNIRVTRNGYTQITVSGTPTADATITLPDAAAKTKPAAPTEPATAGCTSTANNDGKITGVTTAMEYKKSGASDWTAITGTEITGLTPGTYLVRLKATDTTYASDDIEMTIVGYNGPTPPEPEPIQVTDKVSAVTLDKKAYSFGVGETMTLTASVLPFTAEQELDWSAGNGNVKIDVSADKLSARITALKAGKVSVTAKAVDGTGKKAVCKLTIGKEVPDFTIAGKGNKTSIQAGKTLTMTVNWGGKDKEPANDGITWSLEKVGGGDAYPIASISAKGVLTGITAGKVNVIAASKANPGKSAPPVEITITAPTGMKGAQVTGIDFKNKEALSSNRLKAGKTYKVNTGLTLSGKGKAASNALAWYSSDESVATVSQKGVIKAVKSGTAVITAVVRDTDDINTAPKDSVTVRVYSPVKSLKADRKKLTVGTRDGKQYGRVNIAVFNPDWADDKSVEWKSSNGRVKLAAVQSGNAPSTGIFSDATGSGLTGTKKAKGTGVTVNDGQYLAVMAVTPGTVKLTGITKDGSNKKVTCTVTVRGHVTGFALKTSTGKKGANDVTLSDNAVTTDTIEYTSVMKANSKMTLTPVVDINGVSGSATDKATKKTYAAYKKYTDTSVSYRSSDTSVATVDKKGKISVKKGTAGKTATIYVVSADGQQKAEILITVK